MSALLQTPYNRAPGSAYNGNESDCYSRNIRRMRHSAGDFTGRLDGCKGMETAGWCIIRILYNWVDPRQVHDNADKFFELVNSRSPATTLGIEYLSPRGQWITPRALPRRWNTSFFITMLPSFENEAEHDVRGTADGTETVQLDWLTPKEALGRAMLRPDHPDRISLPPPQFYLLAELSVIRDWRKLRPQTMTR